MKVSIAAETRGHKTACTIQSTVHPAGVLSHIDSLFDSLIDRTIIPGNPKKI